MRDSRPARILPLALALGACATAQQAPRPTIDLGGVSPIPSVTRDARVTRVAMQLCDRVAEAQRLGQTFSRANPGWCYIPTRKSIERRLGTR